MHGEAKVGEHCVLSYIDIHDEVIPDNVVMHGLKQRDGKFIVRIFGVNDNPKENRLFDMDLEQIEKDLDVKLWLDDSHTLWSAALYPEADTIEEAVSAALNLYAVVHGEEQADLSAWKAAPKKSLCSGFNDADPDAIIAWNRRMADLVTMDEIAKAIRNKIPAAKLRKMKSLTKIQKEWLERRIKKADFSEKMRLHYYLGVILDDEDEVQECFRTIQSEVLASTIKNLSYNENARIVTEKHTVKLPLRVNWGGGWSDTPPYCNENGGTVLNVAILLNGQKPVEVTLEKISEKKIVFDSRDMDVHGEHLYEFCMDNRMYSEHAYQSDPEGDEPSADITLDEVGLCKGQKFALHYDFGDDWMFTITVSKISEVQEDFEPRVIKSKGTIQQYPDWDEEDFDEE